MNDSNNISDIKRFKGFLGKIGSGANTSKSLNREEASEALRLILQSKASPAQIGAFLIAHRIRRPEPAELAGMLDTYKNLGPKLNSKTGEKSPICFGMPFDGRNKTLPIYPLTILILLHYKQPVVIQGGQRMPVKYGITSFELFTKLGINLKGLSPRQTEEKFQETGFALIHQPDHFPLAESLITYRDEIGKRPPLATLELMWSAHQGKHLLICGFVHPPTEELILDTLRIYGEENIILVKGLEGGIDLSTNRKCIIRLVDNQNSEKINLHALRYKLEGKDNRWEDIEKWHKYALEALNNTGPLLNPMLWNAGVYLWLCGITNNITDGIKKANECIYTGSIRNTFNKLIESFEK